MNISIQPFYRYKKYIRIIRIIAVKKPLLIFRILINYVRLFIFQEKIVRKVEMGVTFNCQCNCPKCSSVLMKDKGAGELSLSELRRAAGEILSLGAIQINFTGGEPLLAKDFFEIVKCFQPQKAVITINTNGLLLTPGMIDKLEAAGVDIIKISMDSPVAEEHDKSRATKGCFDQALKALAYIKNKKRIIGQISTVCIKENLNSYRIWKLVEIAKEHNALIGLTVPAASGRWLGNEQILLDEKERNVLRKLIKLPHAVRDTEEAYLRSHCPAGSEEFYLTCYGDIIPCPLIQISFGNVKKEPVKKIWERMSNFKEFKNKKKFGCLAGENKYFINRYLSPLKDYKTLPVLFKNHPEIQKENYLIEKNT